MQNLFKKIPFYIWLVSHNPVLLHPLSKRRKVFRFWHVATA